MGKSLYAQHSNCSLAKPGFKTALHLRRRGKSCSIMTDINLNYWGLAVVPVGVAICFFPALLIWIWEEFKAGRAEKQNAKDPGT